jgi:hypothetical protein
VGVWGRLFGGVVALATSAPPSWEMQDHMRKELVISALEMAVAQRKPDECGARFMQFIPIIERVAETLAGK